jgi:hypothetical protein
MDTSAFALPRRDKDSKSHCPPNGRKWLTAQSGRDGSRHARRPAQETGRANSLSKNKPASDM